MGFLRRNSIVMLLAAGVSYAFSLTLLFGFVPGQRRKARALEQPPRVVAVKELAATGSSGLTRVALTDFRCADDYVFQLSVKKGSPPPTGDQSGHGKAWIPLFPKTIPGKPGDDVPPKSIKVLLETSPTIGSGTAFKLLSSRPTIDGLATPFSQREMPAEVRSKLLDAYPDTDFGTAIIVVEYAPYEIEDAPFFADLMAFLAIAGLLFGFVVGSFGFYLWYSNRQQSARTQIEETET